VDTGGWYKLCCPSSQLAKPDVLGAIYRVRRKGAPKVKETERRAAYSQLNLPSLDRSRPATELKEIALKRDAASAPRLNALLEEHAPRADASAESAAIVRNAAEGLGRIGYTPAAPSLLKACGLTRDPVLLDSLTFALIQIGDSTAIAAGLNSDNPSVQRAALIALDQMDGGGLRPEQVTPLLTSSDPETRRIAGWIVGHHPDWGGSLANSLRQRLAAKELSEHDRTELERQLAQFSRDGAIQELIAATAADANAPQASRLSALQSMAQAHLKETPTEWHVAVVTVLDGADSALTPKAVIAAREMAAPKTNANNLAASLLRVAENAKQPDEVRLDALAAVPGGLASVSPELFKFLCANLDVAKAAATRGRAANVLAKAKLGPDQLSAMTDSIQTATPLEITRLLSAYDACTDEALGLRLVSALEHSKGLAGLSPATLKPRLTNFPMSVQEKGNALLMSMNADSSRQAAHLDELTKKLPSGDVRRGQLVFNSPRAACVSCHSMGYLGGKIGPDLTSIGQARTERDLLESIIYPSASFVRSYEPMIVSTRSGDEFSGVVRKDAADEVVLATGPETEARIARADISEIRPGTVSTMPQGLDEQLSRQELADLVAFLKNTKWGAQ
jgi:putative heme-binding domain-containing protein